MCVIHLTREELADVQRQLKASEEKIKREREQQTIRVHVPKGFTIPEGYKLALVPDNPQPKVIAAPPMSTSEIMALRAHIDEAKTDPDYDVVWSYQADWGASIADTQEIGYYSYEFPSCTT